MTSLTDSRAPDRRSFLRLSAAASLGALTVRAQSPSSTPSAAAVVPDYCLFTKHLLGMEAGALGEHVASLGFAGVEAPVRPGGHVEPARAAEDLPVFVAALAKAGVKLTILTSAIDAVAKEQHTETVLRAAATLGVKFYRMNWFRYDLKKPLAPQLEEIRAKGKDLIALSKEIGIRPLYQNHNGANLVGAAVWDIEPVMRDFAPEEWGFAYDIMHGTIVGGTSWEQQYQLARPRIGAAYFKDFQWKSRLKPAPCPLGEGSAAAPEYARFLRQSGFALPVSLHIEYLKAQRITNEEEAALAHAAATRDFAILRTWMEG